MTKYRFRRSTRRSLKALNPIAGLRTKLKMESLEDRVVLSTLNVNSTADILHPAAGVVTLRSAIQQANQTPGGNTINLTVAGTYKITLPGTPGETNNAAGEFAILPSGGDLTLVNTSGGAVTIDANHVNRAFEINPNFDPANPTPKFTVTLQGVTIENGIATDAANPDGPNASGGGIRDNGNASLTLNNAVVTNNTASADGGGIVFENTASVPWTLTTDNTVISDNHAGDAGGGIDTDGSGKLFINAGTVITGNSSVNQGAGIWLDAIQVGTVFQTATLTVTGAVISDNAVLTAGNVGGGIGNAGNGVVTIVSSTIENNSSAGTGGGFGDENAQGTLIVQNSLFVGNTAFGNGGSIAAGGPMTTITNSEFKDNSSATNGGGIFANGVTLTVLASTLAANTAAANGGGFEVETTGTGANASTINSTTITGNSALNNGPGDIGGGVDVGNGGNFTGTLTLLNDTLDANFAFSGGGLAVAHAGVIHVENTIIAHNLVTNAGPDYVTTNGARITSLGGNLIGIPSDGTFNLATDQVGTAASPLDAVLGALQNNGGPTVGAAGDTLALETQSLLLGSPAIDKGLSTGAPTTDERGFNRAVNNKVDVGAYEFQPPATTTMLTSSANPGQVGQAVTFQATVTGNAPGSNSPTGTVTFFDGHRTLATVPLNGGVATLTLKALAPGKHEITAVYNGVTVGDFAVTPSTSTPLAETIKGGLFAVAGSGHVQVRHVSDGSLVLDFVPYPGYTGPISVAVGDVNGDGFPDLVTGAMEGSPDVRVYDGQALAQGMVKVLAQFFPYGTGFNVGANVAVGDISGNGYADIVTGATMGNPDTRVYSGKDIANGTFDPNGNSLLAQWFPYALQFNVGTNVAVGDVNGDGYADVVTGANIGNPDVRVYNGKDIANHTFNPAGASQLAQVFAFGTGFNVGAFVAVGDVNGDGFGDIIVGASAGNPQVKVYDGRSIADGRFDPNASLLDQFFAYNSTGANQGVTVGAADFEGTGNFDILTGPTQGPPNYRVVKGNATGTMPPAVNGIDALAADITGALSVGA